MGDDGAVEKPDISTASKLFQAIYNQDDALTLQLLDAGADPDIAIQELDGRPHIPLTIAVESGNTSIVKLLLDKGAIPMRSKDMFGVSRLLSHPLQVAVRFWEAGDG